jgi:hypothetical protein
MPKHQLIHQIRELPKIKLNPTRTSRRYSAPKFLMNKTKKKYLRHEIFHPAVNDIHDILKAYHTVALKRFTDDVIFQVTERLILGIGGPLRTFSPDYVGELQDSDPADIAGETTTSTSRNDLVRRCEKSNWHYNLPRRAVCSY